MLLLFLIFFDGGAGEGLEVFICVGRMGRVNAGIDIDVPAAGKGAAGGRLKGLNRIGHPGLQVLLQALACGLQFPFSRM